MLLTLKTKIWLTVFSIVLMFSFFTLYYFPAQEGKQLLKNYNSEVQNLANTVALGVKIAITEQNFEGVQTAMEFVKDDPRLKYVSMLESDTVWNNDHTRFNKKLSVFKTFPESEHPDINARPNDSIIVKQVPFETDLLSGSIMLAFTTKEIIENQKKIRGASLLVSGLVLIIGILLGFWLSRTISVPVLALRDAANRVGQGDLSQRIRRTGKDEIGELGKAFNRMVRELLHARQEIDKTNASLSTANESLNSTVSELKSTQALLVQSEKLASLGELTAGIAHEIKNPLNFVNNFSDLNVELATELLEEMAKGNYKASEKIANDIKENEQKINNHGKRADSIVRGMLQHSRRSSGIKEPVDINALADEYLRLSYFGLKAKDKSFNAGIKTDFDKTIGNINIIPQDVGRVLLNLYNNAFYAVNENRKHHDENYEPVVSVTTKALDNNIEISIKDNGIGIPQNIVDKIFQPFFTTKPTGQGTGLGLSLSYDIIKAHGGELKVKEADPGDNSGHAEGAEFIVSLPVS